MQPIANAVTLPSPEGRRRRYLVVVLTAILGTLASIAVFLIVGNSENRLAEISFQNQARDRLHIMAADFKASSNLLYSLRAYMEASDQPVTRSEFTRFSQTLHSDVVSLRDTGWAPRVTLAERPRFEATVRAAGLPEFRIMERDSNGKVATAADRPEYFPILYSEGDPDALRFVGLDVAFEPIRRSAIYRAVATGKPAATPPVRLHTAPGPKGGLMSFLAIPGGGSETAPVVKGVVLGAFDIVAMIDNIVATKANLTDLDVYFFEPDALPGDPPKYAHAAQAADAPAVTQGSLLSGTHWAGTVPIMDQNWTAIFVPALATQRMPQLWHAAMPLAVGLTMTAMIAAYLLISLRRTAQLEALSANLSRTTDELRQNMARVTHMARHDLLTGLPNRQMFKERLDEALAHLGRGRPFCLLFLDLDEFKRVNDTLGHAAGDLLLREAAERMQSCLRDTDTLARLGGDEFAIILPETATPVDASNIVHRLIDLVSQPYAFDGHVAVIGVSLGVAIAPDHGTSSELLQIRADLALYAAKGAGRGTARFFDPYLTTAVEARPVRLAANADIASVQSPVIPRG